MSGAGPRATLRRAPVLSTRFSLPITTLYIKLDTSTLKLAPDLQTPYTLRIAPLVAVFLLLSALAHFCLASFGYR